MRYSLLILVESNINVSKTKSTSSKGPAVRHNSTWQHLAALGSTWQHLAALGSTWQLLEGEVVHLGRKVQNLQNDTEYICTGYRSSTGYCYRISTAALDTYYVHIFIRTIYIYYLFIPLAHGTAVCINIVVCRGGGRVPWDVRFKIFKRIQVLNAE